MFCVIFITHEQAIAQGCDRSNFLLSFNQTPMKHSKWLQLHQQGEKICSILRQQGYRITKQHRTLSWKLSKEGQDEYNLTWLPKPVSEWTLVPNNTSPERQELLTLIGRILAAIQTQDAIDYSRPWAIVRLLPNAQHYVVARFANRQDANDYKRYLGRFIPAAEFEVIFDIPMDELIEVPNSEL